MTRFKKNVKRSNRALTKAEQLYGSASELARKIGISKQRFNYWKSGKTLLPYDKAVKIFIVTDGRVSLYDLRPDLSLLTKGFARYSNNL
ncbi:MAG: YdaS family helix-turn-helix protein [bacterium]